MRNLQKAGKNYGPLLSRLWTKVHVVVRQYRRPLVVCNALTAFVYLVSFRGYKPFNLPLSCEIVEKSGFGVIDF